MARDFTKNLSNGIDLGNNQISALVNGASALSFHAWFYPDTYSAGANDNRLLGFRISSGGTGGMFGVDGSGANKVMRVGGRSDSADGFQARSGTTNITTGAWHNGGGVIDFAADTITPYFEGAAEGGGAVTFANSTYVNGTPGNTEAIGADVGNPGLTEPQWDGLIAEVAVWIGDIGAAGFATLNKGFSPLFVRPDLLVCYFPLFGEGATERDRISGLTGTIEGTVAKANHPRIIYPTGYQTARISAATTSTSVRDMIGGFIPFAR